jgi:hypothetical protein
MQGDLVALLAVSFDDESAEIRAGLTLSLARAGSISFERVADRSRAHLPTAYPSKYQAGYIVTYIELARKRAAR